MLCALSIISWFPDLFPTPDGDFCDASAKSTAAWRSTVHHGKRVRNISFGKQVSDPCVLLLTTCRSSAIDVNNKLTSSKTQSASASVCRSTARIETRKSKYAKFMLAESMTDYHTHKARRAATYARLHAAKMIVCDACNGSGHYDYNGAPACGSCGGTGRVCGPLNRVASDPPPPVDT